MTNNIKNIIKRFYSGETEADEEAILKDMLFSEGEMSEVSAEHAYFEYLDKNKIEIPADIGSIALNKIKKQQRLKFRNNLNIWIPRLSAAALIIIVFLIIRPEPSSNTYFSQHLTKAEKKEHFEEALKIVNKSISANKPDPEVLYNDDKFKIVIE